MSDPTNADLMRQLEDIEATLRQLLGEDDETAETAEAEL